jgi:dTDP-4-amino-4,6-dideoxygalactose transaminase
VIRHTNRSGLQACLHEAGIGTLVHYPIPPHLSNAYALAPAGSYPITEKICSEVLSLPIGHYLPEPAIDRVAQTIRRFVEAV